MINKNKLSEIQKKKPITLKPDMAKNMRYKVNQSKASLSKGKYSEEIENTESHAEKEACSPILNTPSQKGTEKSNDVKSQNNKTNEKIKADDTASDNNLKHNMQITNAMKKKEEIKKAESKSLKNSVSSFPTYSPTHQSSANNTRNYKSIDKSKENAIKSESHQDDSFKRNMQITNAIKKKEEIKTNALKLQSKLNEDIKKEREKKIDSVKNSEDYKSAQGQIEEFERYNARKEAAKEQLKRQNFIKEFSEKNNEEKKSESLEITAHTLYLNYLQNQKFNSERNLKKLEKAGKAIKY